VERLTEINQWQVKKCVQIRLKKDLKGQDRFLVSQFCDFLDLIGVAEFNGFSKSDFIMLGSLGKVTTEDFIDFKRIFLKKIEKLISL